MAEESNGSHHEPQLVEAESINEALQQIIAKAPRAMRPMIVGSMIVDMCTAAIGDVVPEAERTDEDAWEGNTPRDFFGPLSEHLLACCLPDAEQMVELWNKYEVEEAEEMAKSEEPLTLPSDWTS